MIATDEMHAADWHALGTPIRLVVTDESALEAGRGILTAEMDALDLACSRFRPDSEVSRLRLAMGTARRISPLLTDLMAAALRAAELTGGDLDPTLGQLIEAVGYDQDFPLLPADGPAPRITSRPLTSWRDVEFDADERIVRVPPGVLLDLGATAKAWAADRAAARLTAELGCGVLVSLGGDIAVGGEPPASGWPIRVQDVTGDPDEPPPGQSTLVSITAGGLATSSTTARRWRRGGQPLHHILDPRSGLPAAPVWRVVSVAAPTALDANIASTTAIIRGGDALGWLIGLGVAARLVRADGAVYHVGGWPAEGSA